MPTLRPARGQIMAASQLVAQYIVAASQLIAQYIDSIPPQKISGLTDLLNTPLFVKVEYQNPAGSYKLRGAFNPASTFT